MNELVECHSDFTYAERPMAFTWKEQRLEISHILKQWRTPRGRGFRVRTRDEQVFELFYDEAKDEWQIQIR